MATTKIKRIRKLAESKVNVRITTRTRSSTGFDVHYPDINEGVNDGSGVKHCTTKDEALSFLEAKLRCFEQMKFAIKPAPKGGA